MTFIAPPIAPFSMDLLSSGDPSSFAAGQAIPCTGTPSATGATVSSGQITIYSGSHWRIEYSPCFTGSQFEIQLYNFTDSSYIGQSCVSTSTGSYPERKCRQSACALILNSEISTSMVIEARIVSLVSMGSRITATVNKSFGNATFRIMELPA